MSLGLHLPAALDERQRSQCDMPSISRPNRQINRLSSKLESSKATQPGNYNHCNGLLEMKEYSLITHIESLRAVANASTPVIPLCHSGKVEDDKVEATSSSSSIPASSSCQLNFPHLASLTRIREHLESPSRPSSSKWARDPDSVPGNLRKNSGGKQTTLTLDEILSCGSSSVIKRSGFEDDEEDVETEMIKKVSKHRKKSAKSMKRKQLKKSPSHGGKDTRSSLPSTHHSIKEKSLSLSISPLADIASITALCKGIQIQEKQPNSISIKDAPYSRKTSISNSSGHKSSQSPFRKSLEHAMSEYSKQSQPPPSQSSHPRKSVVHEEIAKMTKVFLSEKQSGVISDCGACVPCAPPATPTPEQLKRFEYVPSLQDIRAQRSFRQRLQMMETRASKKEKKKQADCVKQERMTMREKRMELKKKQRLEVYALNKIMTELEHQRFRQFMLNAGSNI